MHHTFLHENMRELFRAFRYDAHPMGMMISALAFMSTLHKEAAKVENADIRYKQMLRILGKLPTVAAFCYRHRIGRPFNYPNADLGYAENFLYMLDYMNQTTYEVNPVLAKALDVLFILHADHEQNASTSVMRSIGSAYADPYSAMAGAAAALFGPRHGGANEAVVKMLAEIGDAKNVPDYVARVKKGEFRLMGFGHRVYKNYDPRARIIKKVAYDVFEVTGTNPLDRRGRGAGRSGAARRVLRRPQALSQRGLLQRHHLPGDALPARHVHRALHARACARLAGAVAGNDHGHRAEDRPPAAGVPGLRQAGLRAGRAAVVV